MLYYIYVRYIYIYIYMLYIYVIYIYVIYIYVIYIYVIYIYMCLAKSLAAERATFSGTPERIVGRCLRLLHCCLQLTEHSWQKVLVTSVCS